MMRDDEGRLRAVRNLTIFLAAGALTLSACGSSDTEQTDADGAESTEAATDGAMEDDTMEDGTMEEMEDGEHDADHDGEGHDHSGVIEVPDGMAIPEVAISVEPDAHSGYNLSVDVDNFTIAPERASTEAADGEGHLHLYVNGERLFRFYNTDLNLVDLPAGDHEFTVEVSSNSHSPYAIDGEPITASATVTIEAGEAASAGEIEVDEVPDLALDVVADPKSGWNVRVDTDFDLGPSAGRAVLWAGETELVHLFGPWWHVGELPEGQSELTVTLRNADNETLLAGGEVVAATAPVPADASSTAEASAADADVVVNVSYANGEVTTDSERVDVALGSTVAVVAESDVAEELHVHGFDIYGDLAPGAPTTVTFEADVPGIFEVELESAGTFLFEVSVS